MCCLLQIYLNRQPNARKKLLVPCVLDKPNPKCYVCSEKPEVAVRMNTTTVTVKTLEDKVRICRLLLVMLVSREGDCYSWKVRWGGYVGHYCQPVSGLWVPGGDLCHSWVTRWKCAGYYRQSASGLYYLICLDFYQISNEKWVFCNHPVFAQYPSKEKMESMGADTLIGLFGNLCRDLSSWCLPVLYMLLQISFCNIHTILVVWKVSKICQLGLSD